MTKMVDSTSDDRTVNNTMRQQYRILTDQEKADMDDIKGLGLSFINKIDFLGQGREYSLAKTKIEEAVMWAVKGLTK